LTGVLIKRREIDSPMRLFMNGRGFTLSEEEKGLPQSNPKVREEFGR
jgi:hypothetical protein